MNASILTIGDELLIGQVINTNQAFIAHSLNSVGVAVRRMLTVGDAMPEILQAFTETWGSFDLDLDTIGLGPTHDDITKKAVCEFFQTTLQPNPEVAENIRGLLERRSIPWKVAHDEQAMFPVGATVVPNLMGTAPGIHFEKNGKHFFVLPGVPYEMKEMMTRTITPFLASANTTSVIRHLTLRTSGVTESALAELIGDVETFLHGATLAFLPAPTGVRLRLSLTDTNAASADARIAALEAHLRGRVDQFVYGTGEEELEEVLGRALATRGLTIAVAESCTGGLIASRITDVSGSSRYFHSGVITYSNEAKTDLLGVPSGIIEREGAVSEAVVRAMAEGVRKRAGTSIGLATTGIAGPSGGTPEKPVGLVWIACSDGTTTEARKVRFGGDRRLVRERASQAALELAWRMVIARLLPHP